MRVGEPFGDSQYQTSATILPGGAAVYLRECGEYLCLPMGGNTDAGILYIKTNKRRAVARLQRDGYVDMSLFGKLDGITYQIGQALAQPQGIGSDQGGQVCFGPELAPLPVFICHGA